MSLFSRSVDLPGLQGVLRDCTPGGKGTRKFKAGDIAVIDAADISRQEAQFLVDSQPSAVVNIAEFSTGAIPNYGPYMLLDAGVMLIESVGASFREKFRDGKKARVTEDGAIYSGETLIGQGTPVHKRQAKDSFNAAQDHLIARMEAYFGNSIEFIHSEGPMLIDGLGIPDAGVDMRDKKVLVVSPSSDHRNKVRLLRNFIREYEPIIVGVDSAADTLVELGYKPDLIVGNPREVAAETLRSGARVILPAEPDGTAEGLERIQDLGLGAMTFPAGTDSATDLALLLADYHDAQMIVQVGGALDLDDVFAAREHATPAALLTRVKAGTKVVDAQAVIHLYTAPSGTNLGWLWALLGLLVFLAALVAVAGFVGDGSFAQNLEQTWDNVFGLVKGWFS